MFANQFKKKSQAERIGTYLAQELSDAKDAAVKVQVFQSSLLTTVEQTLKERSVTPTLTEQQQVTMAVMQLAETYARFDPPKETPANGVIPNLLNLLWRAQYDKQADLLDDAVLGLKDLLLNVDQPMQAVQFLSNLLKVADTVVGLGDDLKDPAFLKKLVEFAGKYAKLNPDTSLSADPQGFLDELWRAPLDDAAALKRAGAGLSDFFEGATTREQLLKRLEFGGNLLEAAKLAPSTQQQVQDPRFVDALLGLGSAYASLDPVDEAMSQEEEPLNFFLNTLWRAQDIQDIQAGAGDMNSFFMRNEAPEVLLFETPDERLELLNFQKKLLITLQMVPTLKNALKSAWFVNELVETGRGYVFSEIKQQTDFANSAIGDPSGFFKIVWNSKASEDLRIFASNYIELSLSKSQSNDSYLAESETFDEGSYEEVSSGEGFSPFNLTDSVTANIFETLVRAEGLDQGKQGFEFQKVAGRLFEDFSLASLNIPKNTISTFKIENPLRRRRQQTVIPDGVAQAKKEITVNGAKTVFSYRNSILIDAKKWRKIDIKDENYQLAAMIDYLAEQSEAAVLQQGLPATQRVLPALCLMTNSDIKLDPSFAALAWLKGVVIYQSDLGFDKNRLQQGLTFLPYLKFKGFRAITPLSGYGINPTPLKIYGPGTIKVPPVASPFGVI